jgi:cytochrome c peroxidase
MPLPTPRTWRRTAAVASAATVAILAVASTGSSADPATPVPAARAPYAPYFAAYRHPGAPVSPADNALTPERRELGKLLFFDPRLSGASDISCATCHDPARSWGDGRPRAIGAAHVPLGRRTPTVLNTAWAAALFWDGRAETLEEQALGPIQAAGEMNLALPEMEKRLNAVPGYRELFRRAYGADRITAATVAKAIAAYERTVVSAPAPFDRWVAGDDRAISEEAKRGFLLFNGKASCATCHSGWRFTDDSFHDIGVAGSDSGRAKVLPGFETMEFAFKTPTLRNAVERAPYMHDGSERTLEDVVELYDRGGVVRRASLSPAIRPLGLTASEKQAVVAFLRTLSSPETTRPPAALPR